MRRPTQIRSATRWDGGSNLVKFSTQFESRLFKDVSDHRCEIANVKFRALFAVNYKDVEGRETPVRSGKR